MRSTASSAEEKGDGIVDAKILQNVVRELRRSPYEPAMAVLGSRERLCVNPHVQKRADPSGECKRLLDTTGCRPHTRAPHLHASLPPIWDIEDIASKGRSMHACAFYAARIAASSASLVLCPYTYLLDPVVRDAVGIDFDNALVIIDEAHNIEDASCEAASSQLRQTDVEAAINELHSTVDLLERSGLAETSDPYRALLFILTKLSIWLREAAMGPKLNKKTDFDVSAGVWTGKEAAEMLSSCGIRTETIPMLMQHVHDIMEKDDEEDGDDQTSQSKKRLGPRLSGVVLQTVERLLVVSTFMLGSVDGALANNVEHYNVVVQNSPETAGGGDLLMTPRWQTTLSFWCMLPKVAFAPLAGRSRCVVLASGTLTPTLSFSSELGVPFGLQLEGRHVVDAAQVWVGALGRGPQEQPINVVWKNASQLSLQDEIGMAVLNICRAVPGGVLVFFPSYGLMEKLSQRWAATSMWADLRAIKMVIKEPSGGGSAFDEALQQYRAAAPTGALLLAVCRGKAAEGIDFADHDARAVVIVGIPYPSVKDLHVQLKREYNDAHVQSHRLLSGSQWYSLQAFRAVNQCAGRALRHRRDFGAIILLDDRFAHQHSRDHLSSWMRSATVFPKFSMALGSMVRFFRHWNASPPDPPPPAIPPSFLRQRSAQDPLVHIKPEPGSPLLLEEEPPLVPPFRAVKSEGNVGRRVSRIPKVEKRSQSGPVSLSGGKKSSPAAVPAGTGGQRKKFIMDTEADVDVTGGAMAAGMAMKKERRAPLEIGYSDDDADDEDFSSRSSVKRLHGR